MAFRLPSSERFPHLKVHFRHKSCEIGGKGQDFWFPETSLPGQPVRPRCGTPGAASPRVASAERASRFVAPRGGREGPPHKASPPPPPPSAFTHNCPVQAPGRERSQGRAWRGGPESPRRRQSTEGGSRAPGCSESRGPSRARRTGGTV